MALMRVAVGISGGVDSAVAAQRLIREGHDVVGVTMTLGRTDEEQSLAEARMVAQRLGIELRVCDWASDWRHCVSDYVRETYLNGNTPNPCVRCNEFVKFGLLPRWAFETLGCDYFATGHYARLEAGQILRGIDHAKDQSYFLYRVAPQILKRTLFPLGESTKTSVRAEAEALGLAVSQKRDSQDFCGGDMATLIGASERPGNIVTTDGRVLGQHLGYWHYTVGKRKGLGIGGGTPYYVIALRPATNEVVVGPYETIVRHDFELRDTVGIIDKNLPVKVRSAGEPCLLSEGIAGVAPGQSAVFYSGDMVVGGGIIV